VGRFILRMALTLAGFASMPRWLTMKPRSLPDGVGHTPRVLMQGRRKSRRRTPTRIPLYSY
jgi:hypothetical protein